MRYGSVCSGIEAATVAWHPLGWEAAWYSEIEPFPCAVLKHHYPAVPNYGDMTKYEEWPDEPINLLVGGTPCQSFSVAGLRKGLADPRGNLMLTYGAIARRYRPEWLVWENVPGVLSSNEGRDFGTFLGMLAELGYGFAYRVLDAQYFGVAQRRRRVFVVANARSWQRAAAVLFESHSLQGHPAPSREARKNVAGNIADRFGISRNTHEKCVVQQTHYRKSRRAQSTTDYETWVEDDAINTLNCFDVGDVRATDVVAQTVTGSHWDSPLNPHPTLNQSAKGSGGIAASDQELFSQRGSGLVAQPIAIQGTIIGRNEESGPNGVGADTTGAMFTLTKTDIHAVAQPINFYGGNKREDRPEGGFYVKAEETSKTLDAASGLNPTCSQGGTAVMTAMQVRRLTPVECERLQGFPDGYTNIPWRKASESPDGPRYKALGNSMAVPVMAWIGKRIQQVSEL